MTRNIFLFILFLFVLGLYGCGGESPGVKRCLEMVEKLPIEPAEKKLDNGMMMTDACKNFKGDGTATDGDIMKFFVTVDK